MGKFVYLSFIQWHPGGNRELMEKIVSNMKHEKVELLHHGPSYGTIEDYARAVYAIRLILKKG